MKKRERPPLFEVRHSPVHGFGVFALRRIRKGTTITEYLGDRVSHEEADSRYADKDPSDNHTFLFTVDSKTVIDGGVGGNDARFINHGCDPNCESASLNKRIYVEAVRTIQPGEELAYDYQIQRDPDDPPDVDEIFACRCGAEKCRGSMLVAPKKPRKAPRSGGGGRTARRVAKSDGRSGGKQRGRVAAHSAAVKASRKPAGKSAPRKRTPRKQALRKRAPRGQSARRPSRGSRGRTAAGRRGR